MHFKYCFEKTYFEEEVVFQPYGILKYCNCTCFVSVMVGQFMMGKPIQWTGVENKIKDEDQVKYTL